MSVIQFRSGLALTSETLTIGDRLEVWGKGNYIFVKVTRKGFNILNLDTNRMLFKKHHLYGKGMAGKEYPKKGPITVKVLVPARVRVEKKEERKAG